MKLQMKTHMKNKWKKKSNLWLDANHIKFAQQNRIVWSLDSRRAKFTHLSSFQDAPWGYIVKSHTVSAQVVDKTSQADAAQGDWSNNAQPCLSMWLSSQTKKLNLAMHMRAKLRWTTSQESIVEARERIALSNHMVKSKSSGETMATAIQNTSLTHCRHALMWQVLPKFIMPRSSPFTALSSHSHVKHKIQWRIEKCRVRDWVRSSNSWEFKI